MLKGLTPRQSEWPKGVAGKWLWGDVRDAPHAHFVTLSQCVTALQ